MAEELPDRVVGREAKLRGKGVSVYSIVSAQAGGVSDAVLRALAGTKLDTFLPVINDYLEWYSRICEESKSMTLQATHDVIYSNLVADTKTLIATWKAGLGLQMGTAFMGLQETYMGVPQLLSIYKTEQLDASLRPRLERYWLAKYTPNVPDSRLAFQMYLEGKLNRAEFNAYCLLEGWEKGWHDKLYAVYDRDPDEYLAFTMFKRGLIDKSTLYRCFKIRRYDDSWHDKLYSALHRRPSFRELMVLADYVELPDLWVREVLRADGRLDTDIQYIAPALAKRPLREEVRSVVGRYLWEYQIGRIDRDSLEESLKALGLLPKELELNLLWGDLRYADELLDEKIDILEARVQAGDPALQTQDAMKTAIVDLGVLEEKANLMAELWYYQYVYTPP